METLENAPTELFEEHEYRPSLQRATTEFFAAAQTDNMNLLLSIEPRMPRDKSLYKYLFCSILVTTLSIIGLYYGYSYDQTSELKVYNNTVYAFLFLIICNLFIVLDYTDKFSLFQTTFEIYGIYYLIFFLLIAFIDYLLISLHEDSLLTGISIIISIEILYYITLILCFCTFMSYWKSWSFHCSGKPWIHSLLYLSIIGAIFIFICRWLHPPPKNENKNKNQNKNDNININHIENTYWHKQHNINSILSCIIYILTLLFIFCVLLGGIGICLFSAFATWTLQFDISIAFILYILISFIIMLTPLAPGSIIDICGGFIFILLLVPTQYFSFFISWLIALISIIILHYIGACIQWYMGTWRCIQIWANINLPIEMLSASDAVLRNSNWFKVGLIGYIFLDTANGLNQGRINMDFWTQLFSEWTAIPNAIGLVSFGATIGINAIGLNDEYNWTLDTVPLLIIFSTVIQCIGFTFGTKEMVKSIDKKEYWCSREKWEMMHYLKKNLGYIPTINGWKNDVFNLSNNINNICNEFNDILYNKIYIIHNKYIQKRNKLTNQKKRLNLYKKYLNDLCIIRQKHYQTFIKYIPNAMEKEWLIYEKPKVNKKGYFYVDNYNNNNYNQLSIYKQYLYYILVILLIITFWCSFYGFYWTSNLNDTVTNGINVLNTIEWYWYCCLFLFIFILIFINHIQIILYSKLFCHAIYFICNGCKIHKDIETKFETPIWTYNKPQINFVHNDNDINQQEQEKFLKVLNNNNNNNDNTQQIEVIENENDNNISDNSDNSDT